MKRRQLLVGASIAGLASPNFVRRALAAEKRRVTVLSHANVLHIHIPGNAAVQELLPQQGEYLVELKRLEKLQSITQTLIAGGVDIANTDPTTIVAAVNAGADLKIFGHFYNSVDLAWVANADKVRTVSDLTKSDVIVGVNAPGDVVHAAILGVLLKNNIEPSKVKVLGLGGSSSRMRALISGRVHCVPIHLDQVAALQGQGNYHVLVKPWEEFRFWSNEVWAARGDWLKVPANQRLAVDLIKAQLTANSKANNDFGWFVDHYRKLSLAKDADKAPEEPLKLKWAFLRNEVRAWPAPMSVSTDDFNSLIPIYASAGIAPATARFDSIVDGSVAKQAQQELKI